MHIVTKFLIVFAAVLSMVLSGLTIAYTSNASTLRRAVQLAENKASQASAQTAAVTAAAAAERESLQQKINDLETSLQQSTARVADLQGENARLLAEVNTLKQAAVTHSAQIDQFTAVIQTYAALNKSQSDELTQLRAKELESARKEIELSDRVNDLVGELEVARETNRSLHEQLVAAREALDRAQQGVGAAAASPGELSLLRAPPNFRSQIVKVSTDAAGNTLVTIPAGASDGLRERMRLSIVREGFLAALVLERVDQSESVGRVDFLGRKGISVREGDRVIASTL